MKQSLFTVEHTRQLTADTYEMILSGDTSAITAPGQFVNLDLPGHFLRRPISICNWTDEALMLLVKVVGQGTRDLVRCVPGEELDVLTGLGNGFDLDIPSGHPVLAGGGIGIAPLYGLAQRMLERGQVPTVALGFRTAKDTFYLEEFAKLGCRLLVATEDGSIGTKGFVTDCVRAVPECDYVLSCGPLPMLKAVHALPQLKDGQFSFEARMGCGFGACMGCTIPTVDGYKRVCKDGPILFKEEIVW
ncbi:MAG: dihydroorotate dehydrogenase electron transfer subunit [Oscillospiraceae bacterium]|nr:dihydroorotate dehydrogenase electron transfer subunit [Oscillospiraceae bacterium]